MSTKKSSPIAILKKIDTAVFDRFTIVKPVLLVLITWDLVTRFVVTDSVALPPPIEVASTVYDLAQSGNLYGILATSIGRMISAFLIAVPLAIIIGISMGRVSILKWFFDPIVSVGFPIPKVIFIPIYLIWFGFGHLSLVLLAATSAVFPVIIAAYEGSKNIKQEYIWTAESIGLGKIETMRKVIIPASLPSIFPGLHIGLFLSIILVVVTEMVTTQGGLGEQLVLSVQFYEFDKAIGVLILTVLIGITADRLFRQIESQVLAWQE